MLDLDYFVYQLKKNLLKIKKIQNFFFVMTIIFFLSHLIYLFYTKEAKYTSFLFICAFGLSLGFDNSGISRMNACLTLSLLLIPLIYNTLFETKVSDLDKIMFILFSTLLNFYMIYIFNALTIFLLISSSLLTLLIIILGKTYFLPENLSNHINLDRKSVV